MSYMGAFFLCNVTILVLQALPTVKKGNEHLYFPTAIVFILLFPLQGFFHACMFLTKHHRCFADEAPRLHAFVARFASTISETHKRSSYYNASGFGSGTGHPDDVSHQELGGVAMRRSLRSETILESTHNNTDCEMGTPYETEPPKCDEQEFQRMFGVTSDIAMKVIQCCIENDPKNFPEPDNTPGQDIIPAHLKVLAVLKTLRFGTSFAAFQNHYEMDESTIRRSFHAFFHAVSNDAELLQTYMSPMTRTDAAEVMQKHLEQHKVPGMAFSIGYSHILWKACPEDYAERFKIMQGQPIIVLEAGVDSDLYFWHTAVAYPTSQHDIAVWEGSPLYEMLDNGQWSEEVDPLEEFEIGGERFCHLWFAVDGKYPDRYRFLKPVDNPQTEDEVRFTKWHQSTRMDVERGLQVLQSKFRWLARPIEVVNAEEVKNVIMGCVIMHNMMVRYRQEIGAPCAVECTSYCIDDSIREKLRVELNTEKERKEVVEELLGIVDVEPTSSSCNLVEDHSIGLDPKVTRFEEEEAIEREFLLKRASEAKVIAKSNLHEAILRELLS